MDANLEKLANQAENEAKAMQFKTEKQITDFLKSIDDNDDTDD